MTQSMNKEVFSKESVPVMVHGLGVISSIGIGWQDFWNQLLAGKSGISQVESFDSLEHDRHHGGEVKNFDPQQFMSRRRAKSMGRASQMAVAAVKLAMKDAALSQEDLKTRKVALCVGTTMGESQEIERLNVIKALKGECVVDSGSVSRYPAGQITSHVASFLKVPAQTFVFSNACASGNYALGYAFDLIRQKKVDTAIVVGVDAFSRTAFTGFARMKVMAEEKCAPFSDHRTGMMLAEGAGAIILSSSNVVQDGYAEMMEFGVSCDAEHMTHPSLKGVGGALRKCMARSGISSEQVSYINAHGTGTIENDETEVSAFRHFFNRDMDHIQITSIKSMLGHSMGAASCLESIACSLICKYKQIPPTINFESNHQLTSNHFVPGQSVHADVHYVLNNSQAFGGLNCIIMFKTVS